jgi:hypothetical protein
MRELKMNIAGFIVVRRPKFNYSVHSREPIPAVNHVYYTGIDRQRWADVFDDDFYAKKTPEEIRMLAQSIRTNARDFSGIELCPHAEAAYRLLQYSNRNGDTNELIAVRSTELEATKGTVETELPLEWMGYDIFALGEWSLIAEGFFRNPGYYSRWAPSINRFGLFDDPSLLNQYASTYETAVAEGISEPIAPKSAGLGKFSIEVGRVP